MNAAHGRRSIRLQDYDYAQAGAYFVTICAHDRACLFGDVVADEMHVNELGQVVEECWAAIPTHFPDVELDAFCVMPNHLHGIIVITDGRGTACRAPTIEQYQKPVSGSLPTIIRSFKSAVTKRIRELRGKSDFVVWQRNYYEHVIRAESGLATIRTYVANNPLQWVDDENNLAVK